MATTLGGVTLADPAYEDEGYTVEAADVGTMHQMADGSAVYDSVTTKKAFSLSWKRITEAQKVAIYARYIVKDSQAFSPPDEAVIFYSVLVVPNSWSESYIEDGGGTRRYNCGLRLVEVS